MHKITVADCASRPWKNGGGITTELAAAPHGAGLDDFDWRISTARVEAAGPFSRFDGIDRSLAVLAGAGLSLRIDGGPPLMQAPGMAPLVLRGEQAVHAALPGGAVTDLNVMTRRARWAHVLQRLTPCAAAVPLPAGEILFIYCVAGAAVSCTSTRARGVTLATGEAVLIEAAADERFELRAAPQACVHAAALWRRAPG